MKGWVITILAVLGGFVAIRWITNKAGQHTQLGTELSGTNPVAGTPVGQATGVGDFAIAPIVSGVPMFNTDAIANGHGDQVSAAYHANTLSTLPGQVMYEPAFGPATNQNPNNTIYFLG
jgi:hypothetical protein